MGSFLAQLPQLQQLQHLELHDVEAVEDVASAASYAALTTSSHLTTLRLIDCSISRGAAQHMFAAGRQLQQLQQLDIGASDTVHSHYASGVEGRQRMKNCSLVLGSGDLQRLVTCCPNLTQLALIWPAEDMSSAAVDLRLLLQLTRLTGLTFGGAHVDNQAAKQVLQRMTGEHCYHLTLHLRYLMSFALMRCLL
jgi:hypothetical protein